MPARRNRDLPCFNYSLAAASALQRPEQARPDARRQRNIEDLDEEQVEEEAAEAGDDGGLGTESRSDVERDPQHQRSEEHTSELQSLMRNSYAVFCLKKKTVDTIITQKQILQSNYCTPLYHANIYTSILNPK